MKHGFRFLVLGDAPETRLLCEKSLRKSPFPFTAGKQLGRPAEYCGSCGRAPLLWISFWAEKNVDRVGRAQGGERDARDPGAGYHQCRPRTQGFSLGADAYCLTPIRRDTLIRQLQALTGASGEISGAEQARQTETRNRAS
jgi:hypothetical protein